MTAIDTSTDFGKRLEQRLQDEHIIWLTTVSENAVPQSSPVWFHRVDDQITIFSQPNTPKLRNIARHPVVSLHLNSSDDGGDVAVLTGTAEILADGPKVHQIPEYVTKYEDGIRRLKMTPEEMAASYSETIRITVSRVRGW